MARRIVAGLVGLALALVSAPAMAACHLSAVETPVTMVGLRGTTPLDLNGFDVGLVVDSGSFLSAISQGAARRSDAMPVRALDGDPETTQYMMVQGSGGMTETELARVESTRLGGMRWPDTQYLVIADDAPTGLLGQNLLSALGDVEYDFADGVLRLVKPIDCKGQDLAYWAKTEPYSVVDTSALDAGAIDSPDRHTVAYVYVNGVRLRAVFDSASETMISLAAAARAGITPQGAGVRPGAVEFGLGDHAYRTWIAPVASVKVGDEEIRNTHLRIADGTFADHDLIIGVEFFLAHRIYVSNAQNRMFFTYNGGPVFDVNIRGTPRPAVVVRASYQPSDADGFARRAEASLARGQTERAIADLTSAIQKAPSEPRYLEQRAIAYFRSRQFPLAVADLNQALKLKPREADALIARAEAEMAMGDKAAAVGDVDLAAQLSAKDKDRQLGLGVAYSQVGAFDAAIALYDQWIAAHRGDTRLADALDDRCRARALAGKDLDKALDDCDRAVRKAPKVAGFVASRGLVRLRQGALDAALADYDAALTLDPDEAWSLYGRGLIEQRRGQTAPASADIAAATAIDTDLPDKARRYGLD